MRQLYKKNCEAYQLYWVFQVISIIETDQVIILGMLWDVIAFSHRKRTGDFIYPSRSFIKKNTNYHLNESNIVS